ncbi:hypothetical protein [Draconibacterium sp.]|uniref:hypothetical protein n=1 Tax=Draconibacterium sp. TaxID=1965318 RepID=UPI003563D82B
MKLKKFNNKTLPRNGQISGSIHITFNKKGVISFSKSASDLLNLKDGDRIVLHQDEENRGDWYLEKTEDENGFKLHKKSNKDNRVCFGRKILCQTIAKSLGVTADTTFIMHVLKNPKRLQGLVLYELKNSSNKF